jgi:hypothetical protein
VTALMDVLVDALVIVANVFGRTINNEISL